MGPLTPSGRGCASYLRLLTLITLGSSAIYSQTPPVSGHCSATAVPTTIRAEGVSERLGDIVLQCSGSTPGAVLSGNLTIYLPVVSTNRVDSSNQTHDVALSVDY